MNNSNPDTQRPRKDVVAQSQSRARVVTLDDTKMSDCFNLRYAYFVKQRGWVPEERCHNGEESDDYDSHALHLSVWGGEEIAAYLRVLPFDPTVGFMLDHELSAILSSQERAALPREGAVELSRLVCRMGDCLRTSQGNDHPIELLFRQLYEVSLEKGFTRYYIVVEDSWLRPFARRFGLPFQVIGQPYLFPDGTKTVAATATVEELEAGLQRHSQAKFLWYCGNGPFSTDRSS